MFNSGARISPERLRLAICRSGWTYAEATEQVRKHLPRDSKFSSVSLWTYATGRTRPRRISYIEAIEAAFGVGPNGFAGSGLAGSGLASDGSAGDASACNVGASENCSTDSRAEGAEAHSTMILSDAGDGRMRLKIDTEISWQSALRIIDILKQTYPADDDPGSDGAGVSSFAFPDNFKELTQPQ